MSEVSRRQVVTLLVVDDEQSNADLIRRLFRGAGEFVVVEALSGTAGLEALSRNVVDVILVDYSMPEMTGVEFLVEAKKIAPAAVGIIVTAYPEFEAVAKAQEEGLADSVVIKPWRAEDLEGAVRRACAVCIMRRAVAGMKETLQR